MVSKRWCKTATVLALLSVMPLVLPPGLLGQSHVVTREDLKNDLMAASRTRDANLTKIQGLMSSEVGRSALKITQLDERFVRNAVRSLSNEDLSRLTARADQAQQDFAAGQLSNQELTYIIIGLVVAVVIIVIVVA
jgi:hypothetical protein